jgi:hypothetical protein
MAERHVLQGDRRRPEEHGAEEGPETQHENHRGPPASGMASGSRPYRIRGGDGDESSGVTSRDDRDRSRSRWSTRVIIKLGYCPAQS